MLATLIIIVRVLLQRRRVTSQRSAWNRSRRIIIQLISLSTLYTIVWLPCVICSVITIFTPVPFISALNSSYLSYYQYLASLLCPLVCLLGLPEIRDKLRICKKVRPQIAAATQHTLHRLETHHHHQQKWTALSHLHIFPENKLSIDCVAWRVHYRISLFCCEFSCEQTDRQTLWYRKRRRKRHRMRARETHKKRIHIGHWIVTKLDWIDWYSHHPPAFGYLVLQLMSNLQQDSMFPLPSLVSLVQPDCSPSLP